MECNDAGMQCEENGVCREAEVGESDVSAIQGWLEASTSSQALAHGAKALQCGHCEF